MNEKSKMLFEYCKSKKCSECIFYCELAYCCSLGATIQDISQNADNVAHNTADVIQCVNEIYKNCKAKNMQDNGHCLNCEYEYIRYGLYRCELGASVEGFDNPIRWDFAKNLKANSLF